tara:strand:- start:301 stop:534 length:234 start_codon:yes stop_codon:yes gene_type:complete
MPVLKLAKLLIQRGETVVAEKYRSTRSMGDLRRTSMELTNALADMRKSEWALEEEKRNRKDAAKAMQADMYGENGNG